MRIAAVENSRNSGAIAPIETSALLLSLGVFGCCFAALAVFWSIEVRPYYVPSADEFSLLVNSARMFHPSIAAWFLKGFSQYFLPYPGWAAQLTNFFRPVFNGVYYLNSLLFGFHWSLYLFANYFIQSLFVACVVYLSVRHLRFSTGWGLALGFLCLVSPALGLPILLLTPYPFDLLAACFVLLGLSSLLSRKTFLAWIWFTLGVFTKETAFFAPFCAAVSLACFADPQRAAKKKWLLSACFLLPNAAWIGLRQLAFHSMAQGVYAVPRGDFSQNARVVFENLLRWPIPADAPFNSSLFLGHIPESFPLILFAVLNAGFWIIVLVFLLAQLARTVEARKHSGERRGIFLTLLPAMGFDSFASRNLLLFCAGSSGILLLLPHLQPRFGASFIPLFTLSLAVMARSKRSRLLWTTSLVLLLVPAAVNLWVMAKTYPAAIRWTQRNWELADSYTQQIAHSRAPMLLVIDDASGGFSSMSSIAEFSGYKGQLVRLSDVLDSPDCPAQPRILLRKISPGHVEVLSTIDRICSGHAFAGSWISPAANNMTVRRQVGPLSMIYHLPPVPPRAIAAPGELRVEIYGLADSAQLLAPDFQVGRYQIADLSQLSSGKTFRIPGDSGAR